jgi:hypothetical protein
MHTGSENLTLSQTRSPNQGVRDGDAAPETDEQAHLGRLIRGRQPRQPGGVRTRVGVVLGVVFVGFGLLPIALIEVFPDRAGDAPVWLVRTICSLFVLVGAFLAVQQSRAVKRQARVDRLRKLHPDEPWRWDHPWRPDGIEDDSRRKILGAVIGSVFFALLLIPFNWVAFVAREASFIFGPIALLLDLLLACLVGYTVKLIVRRLKYGPSRLRFERFPFHLGETLDVLFSPPRNLDQFNSLTLTLRCILDKKTRVKRRNSTEIKVRSHERWAKSQTIEGPGRFQQVQGGMRIPFELPDEDLETRISDESPQSWELEIKANTPGVDYEATFLVPVYRRRG